MTAPVLYAVRRPEGTIVQAAPSIDRETALWEAAGRDPKIKAFYNHASKYNVATAERKGYTFVEAEVVAKEPPRATEELPSGKPRKRKR